MATRDLVVIGGSAGAIEPLHVILERLPADFPGTVLATIHVSAHSPGYLAEMLRTTTGIPVAYAAEGQRIQSGRVLLAPPDRHLVVDDGVVRLSSGPPENRCRPAIDPMFRSAAAAYGARVVGVVLSGLLDDGADGLISVQRAGGHAIVQDPAEARFPDMPQAALRYAEVDEVLPAAAIPGRLVELSRLEVDPAPESAPPPEPDGDELGRAGFETAGVPSGFACPDCHGALWELHEGALLRFRCRTGHAYSADSAAAALDEDTERVLWAALRSLEEKAALARKLKVSAESRQVPAAAGIYERRLREAEENARTLRRMLGAEKGRLLALRDGTSAPRAADKRRRRASKET